MTAASSKTAEGIHWLRLEVRTGSRDRVGRGGGSLGGVNVDIDAGVGHRVSARELHEVAAAGGLSSSTSNDELAALWVELRSVCLVQGKELVPDEILAGSEGGGDGSSVRKGVHKLTSSPDTIREVTRDETSVCNLEPLEIVAVVGGTGA